MLRECRRLHTLDFSATQFLNANDAGEGDATLLGNLHKLHLFCHRDVTVTEIKSMVKHCTQLRHLHLTYCIRRKITLRLIAGYCPLLLTLGINVYNNFDEAEMAAVQTQLAELATLRPKITQHFQHIASVDVMEMPI